jgi:hypothetical protein
VVFKFARAFNPALRMVAPREHQQASQASAMTNCMDRANIWQHIKRPQLNDLLKRTAGRPLAYFQFDSSPSQGWFLLTD